MSIAPRIRHSDAEKHAFYASAARRFKAELRLAGATAAVHIENKNDEIFWRRVLHEAWPHGRFRFISSSRSVGGNSTCGCTQCLQYYEFLDEHLWIAIDSDYRYLMRERGLDAAHFVLQTYTYSFENHFCYWENCERAVHDAIRLPMPAPLTTHDVMPFSWKTFLENYSHLVYPLLIWQLYLQDINPETFPKSVFHRLLSLPVGPKSVENDGLSVLTVLKERCKKLTAHLRRNYPEADLTRCERRAARLGVRRDNCYLFVRGHQLYDLVTLQGRKLHRRFEQQLLNDLCYGQYDEITRIHHDILIIAAAVQFGLFRHSPRQLTAPSYGKRDRT